MIGHTRGKKKVRFNFYPVNLVTWENRAAHQIAGLGFFCWLCLYFSCFCLLRLERYVASGVKKYNISAFVDIAVL